MKYPYIIIDSDQNSARTIQIALEDHNDYICTGIAENEQDALDLILQRKPRLVFLEPEVPGIQSSKTQYNLLSELTKYMTNMPEFVIITKTTNYAIEGEVLDNTLCFKSYGDYRFVNIDEVLYLKADNNTTDFIMSNGNKVEAFKTLKHFQNLLPDHFVRIHNSYIINTKYVSRIHFGKAKCAIKNTTDMIPFSKSYKTSVEEIKDTLAKNSFLYV